MTTSPEPAAYLDRLGLAGVDLPPTLRTLVALHRAHLHAVPYENLATLLGRPPSVDPHEALARIGSVGRAGYCFHQNAALEVVLRELGFDVVRRHGHTWTSEADRSAPELTHLVLEVRGLPTADNPRGRWWPDVGLGDAFRDPLPVLEGRHEQPPFHYRITDVRDDGWSFRHDPAGSFTGIDISARATDPTAVRAAHAALTDPSTGPYARRLVVQRRGTASTDTVRGCRWTHVDAEGVHHTDLTTYAAWRAALTDGLGLSLRGVDDGELRVLYAAQWARHVAWAGWRRATTDDAAELTRVEREANRVGLAHVFPADLPFPDADVQERWARTLVEPGVVVEVCADPRPVAFTSWDAAGRVRHLAVVPERWGAGLARAGVARAAAAIRAGGGTPRLWVLVANHRARGLYGHLGWVATGARQRSEWPPYPVEMELVLPESGA